MLSTKETISLYKRLNSSVWLPSPYVELEPYYILNLWGTEYRFAENVSDYNGFNIVMPSGEYAGAQGDEMTSIDMELIFDIFNRYCS